MSLIAEYRKAMANYRPGGVTRDLSSTAELLAGGAGMGDLPTQWTGQMGPGRPLPAQPLDPQMRGVTLPRARQYPVGINLQVTPGANKLVDFRTLRQLSKVYDLARRCIEIRRQEIAQMRWEITARDPKQEIEPDRLRQLVKFFEYPDRINGRRWDSWIKTVLEDVFVIDALAIYPHPTWLPGRGPLGSDLFALEILDGATIKPLLDIRGARPMPPLPAYQQVLYGLPRASLVADTAAQDLPAAPLADPAVALKPYFSGEELYYEVYNPSQDSFPYGFSNIEQIIFNVNLALKRQQYWTSYFTDGSVPAGFVEVPEEWTAAMIREFEETWNSMLSSEIGWKHRVKATPGPFTQLRPEIGGGAGVVAFDEWLAKITCIGFDVTPTELGLDPKSGLGGTGWSEQQENVLYRKSLRPLTSWIEVILNEVLGTWLKSPDLRFHFVFEEIEDALKRAQQWQIQFETAQKTANEIRSEQGLPPSDEPNANRLFVVTRRAPYLLEDLDAISKQEAGLNRDGTPMPVGASGSLLSAPISPDAPAPAISPTTDSGEDVDDPLSEDELAGGGDVDSRSVAKAGDLARWRTKALKALRIGRSPAVQFYSEVIPAATQAAIRSSLRAATTPEAVKAVFEDISR